MGTIERFENIEAWKKARILTNMVYEVSGTGAFSKDFGLRDQIRRASVSVMSNIAEGYERDGKKEFIHFLKIAKGSVGEVRSQCYIAFDRQYMSSETFEGLIQKTTEISKLIAGFIKYLKSVAS